MIVASMLLVLVAAALLVLGVLEVVGQPLTLVYASIGVCLLATVLLVAGVLRQRPGRQADGTTGGATAAASWSGATARGGDDLPETVPAPAPWSSVSEAEEAEAQRLDALLQDVAELEPHQRQVLLERYGSIPALRRASREELSAVEGMTPEAVDRVLDAMA